MTTSMLYGGPFRDMRLLQEEVNRLAQSAAGKLKQARAVGTEGEQELSNIPTMMDKTDKIA